MNAFTIFEVTVVLAIMSTLIGIIGVTANRFQEQLKLTSDLTAEQNNWFAFRANLWRELYESDSIEIIHNGCQIYNSTNLVEYQVSEGYILRSANGRRDNLNIEADRIYSEIKSNQNSICFEFVLKGVQTTLSYPINSSIKREVDSYFENY